MRDAYSRLGIPVTVAGRAEVMLHRRRIEAELARVERQVFDLETTYLREAPEANLGAGFAAAVASVRKPSGGSSSSSSSSSSAAAASGGKGSGDAKTVNDAHRIFSATSATSPLYAAAVKPPGAPGSKPDA